MDFNSIKREARKKFAGSCKVCPVCNGVACAGEVPGMGGIGNGRGFIANVEALLAYRLNMSTVHGVKEPVLKTKILGIDLALPVIAAPIGGSDFNMNGAVPEDEYVTSIVAGSIQSGTMGMTGDGPKGEIFLSGLRIINEYEGKGIPVIKPRGPEIVADMARQAAAMGAPAFGMDIDAAVLINMTKAGQKVSTKTQEELAYIKEHTDIPFIVKGIMTPEDAEKCCQAGVDAIVVSNHGGRVLDCTPGTAEVLPDIAARVGGRMTVLVDGGVRSGADVLKMLALGAQAVLVGRPLTIGAVGGRAAGVQVVLERFAAELRAAMILTGTQNVRDVSPDILWK